MERANKDRVKQFKAFLDKQIEPALEEIEDLEDKNRVHIQKLVYTNVVDRFDTLIDDLIRINGRAENLMSLALKQFDGPVTEADLIQLLINSENLDDVFDKKIGEGLSNTVLRKRHSQKVRILLETLAPEEDLRKPRVDPNSGSISETTKVYRKEIPHGIIGYSDFLYSRRNALVHGKGSSKFLSNDHEMVKRLHKVRLSNGFRISYNSAPCAAQFYRDVCDLIVEA